MCCNAETVFLSFSPDTDDYARVAIPAGEMDPADDQPLGGETRQTGSTALGTLDRAGRGPQHHPLGSRVASGSVAPLSLAASGVSETSNDSSEELDSAVEESADDPSMGTGGASGGGGASSDWFASAEHIFSGSLDATRRLGPSSGGNGSGNQQNN